MLLTEQQITDRELAFFDLLETVISQKYDIPEDYEMTEADAYITSIVLEYFIENYKELSINEETLVGQYNIDINQPLYDEIVEMMLDEGVGKFIAGAYHAAKGVVDKAKYNFAKGYASALKQKQSSAKKSLDTAKKASTKAASMGGAKGAFMQGLTKSRAEKAMKKFEKAQKAHGSAAATRDMLKNPLKKSNAAKEQDKAKLASKIDTGISNIKKKASEKVKSGISRLGSAIGRFA